MSLCPQCGAALSPEAALGLCARCLLVGAAEPTNIPSGARLSAPPSVEQVAAAFPQLEVLALIGAGGMGAVFRARQPKLNRLVALKVLPASLAERDPAFAERFEREGQMLARLHHPNIVAVYDSGRAGDFFYLLMEHVDGVNLRQAMRTSRFTPAQALAIVPRICDALQFAHEEGVLHRDIKPENILLDAKGRVKLADFGIGKIIGESSEPASAEATLAAPGLTQLGTALGTPHYMAPEQRDRPEQVDHRADIYSLGVVFYELLTGELPVGKFAPPSELSASDPRVDAIVRQALEKERDRRQQSAGEVRTQVETLAGTPAPPPASDELPKAAPRLSRTALVGACWLPLLFLALSMWFVAATPVRVSAGEPPLQPAWWQTLMIFTLLPLGVAAPFGTTLLGWIAVAQIRRSAGRLYGLGLALFDGLFFPLLILDGLISFTFLKGIEFHSHADEFARHPKFIFLWGIMLFVIAVVDFWIVRTIWRAVRPPLAMATPHDPAAVPSSGCGPRALGILGAALISIVTVLIILFVAKNGTASKASPREDSALVFSPAREQTIHLGPDARSFFSFDGEKFLPPPADFNPRDYEQPSPDVNSAKLWQWLADQGVDLLVQRKEGRPILAMSDMTIAIIEEKEFDRLTPAQLQTHEGLRAAMDSNVHPQVQSVTRGAFGGKATVAFRTRYDVFGLLQVESVQGGPPSVKIRYKLLRNLSASAAPTPAAAVTKTETAAPRILKSGESDSGDGPLESADK